MNRLANHARPNIAKDVISNNIKDRVRIAMDKILRNGGDVPAADTLIK